MACFGSNVLANIPFGTTDLTAFEGCGVGLFGSETPARMNSQGIQDEDVSALASQCRAAHEMKTECYMTQVATFEALSAAVTAGVRFHAGLAVGDESALPVPAKPCSFNDLHARSEAMRAAQEGPASEAG